MTQPQKAPQVDATLGLFLCLLSGKTATLCATYFSLCYSYASYIRRSHREHNSG
ncbi:hypothetical protein SPWS13_1291 [Shewanella putrefaciens]|nr:hypothetical protein SPWS13_1291 [Shewanella putrefaciens]